MSVGFNEAMEQLQAMFSDFDKETIKMMLVQNNGYLEKTIEDLLKLSDNNPGAQSQPVDDNLFADSNLGGGNTNYSQNQNQADRNLGDLGLFGGGDEFDNQDLAKKMQEDEDAKLAYVLQQKYMKRSQQEQALAQRQQQKQRQQQQQQQNVMQSSNVAQYDEDEEDDDDDDDYEYEGQQGEENKNNQYGRQSQQQTHGYGGGAQMQASQQGTQQQQQLPEKKKKKGFGAKIKGAFSSLFKKKGKKANAPTKNPGNYAQIDEGDDQAEAGFSNFDDFGGDGNNDFYGNQQEDNDFHEPKNHKKKPQQHQNQNMQMSDIMGIGDNFDNDFSGQQKYKGGNDQFHYKK